MTPDREAEYGAGLEAALDAGYAVLEHSGSSLDAVTTAVELLEGNPLFNAGRGAVLNFQGVAELDAAIMDGKDRRAGAVAGLRHVQSPIQLARKVMDNSPHVMLVGAGAEEFALTQGMRFVPNEYFLTDARRAQLQRKRERESDSESGHAGRAGQVLHTEANDLSAFGTVGAVARDLEGNLAAATSTGGTTGKRWGRVGDSPIIGAGTYADNASCAVSSTGHGEYFIRSVVAHDICARVAYGKLTLAEAADEVINRKLRSMGGDGGVIAVDSRGNLVLEFNSESMFRGARSSDGRREIAIYR
ncbi:MAG: isoaspartyl peptidase/L-asparaginase [Pseudomonadales bacterium]|nr:isoaspartyl peptidase/L-asparaginase [Pseudomonadales bacterium]